MKAKPLTQHYHLLTPQERFRLILAASGRDDDVERDRLVRTGKRITVSRQDHAPYAYAFHEVALLTFLMVLEDTSRYFDALASARVFFDDNVEDNGAHESAARTEADNANESTEKEKGEINENGAAEVVSCEEPIPEDDAGGQIWRRCLCLAQAAGYVLLAKVDGWRLFCQQLNVPAFVSWQGLPGFDRLQHGLEHAKDIAFSQEEYLCWLNSIRPKATPKITAISLTVEAVAAMTEEAFQKQVRWLGG